MRTAINTRRNHSFSLFVIMFALSFVFGLFVANELSSNAARLPGHNIGHAAEEIPASVFLAALEQEIYLPGQNSSTQTATEADADALAGALHSVIYTPLNEEVAAESVAALDQDGYEGRTDGITELRNMISNAPAQCGMAAHARDPHSCVALNF